MRKSLPVVIASLAAGLALAGSASAAVNLATNGSFSTNGGTGQVNFNTSIAGWNVPALNNSYVFLFGPAAGTSGTNADLTGAAAAIGEYGALNLWGPGDGSANGLTLSPDGGFFLAADPNFQNGSISQIITGLNVGYQYQVSFWYAGAQQLGYTGGTTEGWNVTFGGNTLSTNTLNTGSHGFSGWQQANLVFVANNTSQTLSFLATGGPSAALPPFALLDGVNVQVVPEPTTWALMIMGFGGVGALVRNRRRQAALA